MRAIFKRLQELEQRGGEPLILLIEVDGVERAATAIEYERLPNARFIRVISGCSISDLDRLLEIFFGAEMALKEKERAKRTGIAATAISSITAVQRV